MEGEGEGGGSEIKNDVAVLYDQCPPPLGVDLT